MFVLLVLLLLVLVRSETYSAWEIIDGPPSDDNVSDRQTRDCTQSVTPEYDLGMDMRAPQISVRSRQASLAFPRKITQKDSWSYTLFTLRKLCRHAPVGQPPIGCEDNRLLLLNRKPDGSSFLD